MFVLSNYIADSLEEALESCTTTDDYLLPREAINDRIKALRAELPDAQQHELNVLLNLIDNANADFVEKIYAAGILNGMSLKEEVNNEK